MRALTLALGLLLLPVTAGAATPAEAKATVGQKVHQVDIYAQARATLLKERAALQARATDLGVRVNAAKRNRGVLNDPQLKALLREALDVTRALENTDRKLAALDTMMADAVVTAREALRVSATGLNAADRKALEMDLARVAALVPAHVVDAGLPAGLDIRVTPGMDAEAIQERADLALDYEEKMLKEAARTEARIHDLEAQASVAGEAMHLSGDRRLFDEEDRAMRATRVVGRAPQATAAADKGGNNNATGGGGAAFNEATANGAQNPQNPPPGGGGNASPITGAVGADDTNTRGAECTGGNCGTPANVTGMPRSQTVVDERTFALLRESRAPVGQQSPADELRALQARRDALRKQAARLKALRDELNTRAAQTRANTR